MPPRGRDGPLAFGLIAGGLSPPETTSRIERAWRSPLHGVRGGSGGREPGSRSWGTWPGRLRPVGRPALAHRGDWPSDSRCGPRASPQGAGPSSHGPPSASSPFRVWSPFPAVGRRGEARKTGRRHALRSAALTGSLRSGRSGRRARGFARSGPRRSEGQGDAERTRARPQARGPRGGGGRRSSG